jgi:hypothetical protein
MYFLHAASFRMAFLSIHRYRGFSLTRRGGLAWFISGYFGRLKKLGQGVVKKAKLG